MKSFYFQFGMAAIGGIALLFWGPWSQNLPALNLPTLSSLIETVAEGDPGPAVLVMVIPDVASINAIRESIIPERIIASSEQGFALIDGRVFATSIGAATDPINLAGWADRPIELVESPGGHKPTVYQQQTAEAARLLEEAPEADAYRALKGKGSLSRGESLRLLEEMERRGEI